VSAGFFESILSDDLKMVAEHWRAVRGSRLMPGWSDIRPSAIVAQLPSVWSYKYDPATGEFTGRLAGERIARIFGREFRGSPMARIQPAADFPWVYGMCKRIVSEPSFYRGTGLLYRHLNHFGTGERIIMPLSSDGIVADGILGATDYRLEPGTTESAAPVLHESEQWFSVRESQPAI
jgi:hypothetical protein